MDYGLIDAIIAAAPRVVGIAARAGGVVIGPPPWPSGTTRAVTQRARSYPPPKSANGSPGSRQAFGDARHRRPAPPGPPGLPPRRAGAATCRGSRRSRTAPLAVGVGRGLFGGGVGQGHAADRIEVATVPEVSMRMLEAVTGFSTPRRETSRWASGDAPPRQRLHHRRHGQGLTRLGEIAQPGGDIDAVTDVVVPLHEDDVARGDARSDGHRLRRARHLTTTWCSSRMVASNGRVSTHTSMTPSPSHLAMRTPRRAQMSRRSARKAVSTSTACSSP